MDLLAVGGAASHIKKGLAVRPASIPGGLALASDRTGERHNRCDVGIAFAADEYDWNGPSIAATFLIVSVSALIRTRPRCLLQHQTLFGRRYVVFSGGNE